MAGGYHRQVPAVGQTRAYVALTLVVALWGSYPAFAKLALLHFSPFLLVSLRTLLASAFLTLLLFRRGGNQFRALGWPDLEKFAFLGFVGLFVSTGGTYLGIAFTTASSAVILQTATPVMVALGARVYLGERLRAGQWAGVACSTLGVLLVITRGSPRAFTHLDLLPGDVILLLAQTGWAAYTVYGKRVLAEHDAALTTTGAYILGSLMLLPMAFVMAPFFPSPDLLSPVAWAVVAYQAVLGAVAHVWWYEAVKAVGPSRSAIFMNLQPTVGVLLAWLMLGESVRTPEIGGGIAVLAGVALTTRRTPAERGAASPAGPDA
jgi:drug/metabolite transporter (DMT)-like permease